jgi:hypothetical protein
VLNHKITSSMSYSSLEQHIWFRNENITVRFDLLEFPGLFSLLYFELLECFLVLSLETITVALCESAAS